MELSALYQRSLPVDYYREASFFQKEQIDIFSKNWLFFSPASGLKRAGDYITKKIANIPIVVLMHEDGNPRAFVNICPHRGASLFTKPCGHSASSQIQCPYHGWVFNAEGRVKVMAGPAPKDEKMCRDLSLTPVKLASYQGLLFVHLDPEPLAFSQSLAPLIEIWDKNQVDFQSYEEPLEKKVLGNFNWKVWVEGFQECYHCYYVHPQLKNDFQLKDYKIINYDLFSVHSCERKESSEQTGKNNGVWSWIYPNIGLPVYEYCFYVLQVNPISVNQTELCYYMFFQKNTSQEQKKVFLDFWANLTQEDVVICENIQTNLQSSYFKRGVLSEVRENGVLHFHNLLQNDLSRSQQKIEVTNFC